jgi:hypothetical protein
MQRELNGTCWMTCRNPDGTFHRVEVTPRTLTTQWHEYVGTITGLSLQSPSGFAWLD